MWLWVSSAAVLGTLLRCNAFFTSFSSSSGYTNLSLGSPRPPLSKGLKLSMNILKQGAPVLGFYAVMLAPIYGVGFLSGIVPGLGFGTITDFSQLRNRLLHIYTGSKANIV